MLSPEKIPWQALGVIFTAIAIFIPIIIFIIQRKRKVLTYEVININPIFRGAGNLNRNIKGKIKILFDGNEVKNVYIVVVRIENQGNTPVTSTDYERPISFNFGENAQILFSNISRVTPKSLKPEVIVSEGNSVTLKPALMNPGDSITIETLVSEFDNFKVDARIIGVKDIIPSNKSFSSSGIILIIAGMYLLLIDMYFISNRVTIFGDIYDKILYALLLVISYSIMIMGMVSNKKLLRKILEIYMRVLRI